MTSARADACVYTVGRDKGSQLLVRTHTPSPGAKDDQHQTRLQLLGMHKLFPFFPFNIGDFVVNIDRFATTIRYVGTQETCYVH